MVQNLIGIPCSQCDLANIDEVLSVLATQLKFIVNSLANDS